LEKVERKQRLRIREILDDIRLNDMKTFILQYARKNREFEIAFKSHFLSRINTGDQGLKYKRILEEIIKPKTVRNNKVGPSAKRTISIILDDLVLQMNDCLSTQSYTEAYYLIKESLEKIAYLQNRFMVKDVSIEKCRIQFLSGMDFIIKKDLAPAFRAKLEKELTEIINKSYYYPKSTNLISLLNENNVFIEKEKAQIILDLKKKVGNEEAHSIIKTSIELSYPFEDIAKDVLLSFDHKKIFDALRELINDGKFIYVDFFLNSKKIEFNFHHAVLMSFKYNAQENQIDLVNSLKSIELEKTDIFLLQELFQELDPQFIKKRFSKIKTWVDQLPFRLKTQFYVKASNFKGLINILKKKNDFEWLKLFDQQLTENGFEQEVKALHLHIAKNYIDNHIGIKSTEFLNRMFQHFQVHNMDKQWEELTDILLKEYQHRDSIKELLR